VLEDKFRSHELGIKLIPHVRTLNFGVAIAVFSRLLDQLEQTHAECVRTLNFGVSMGVCVVHET